MQSTITIAAGFLAAAFAANQLAGMHADMQRSIHQDVTRFSLSYGGHANATRVTPDGRIVHSTACQGDKKCTAR